MPGPTLSLVLCQKLSPVLQSTYNFFPFAQHSLFNSHSQSIWNFDIPQLSCESMLPMYIVYCHVYCYLSSYCLFLLLYSTTIYHLCFCVSFFHTSHHMHLEVHTWNFATNWKPESQFDQFLFLSIFPKINYYFILQTFSYSCFAISFFHMHVCLNWEVTVYIYICIYIYGNSHEKVMSF